MPHADVPTTPEAGGSGRRNNTSEIEREAGKKLHGSCRSHYLQTVGDLLVFVAHVLCLTWGK
jgi:hypothetical protein